MTWLRRLVARRQLERDLADEIDAHLAERADELVAEGLTRDEAHRRARREFGNVTAIEERGREVWRLCRDRGPPPNSIQRTNGNATTYIPTIKTRRMPTTVLNMSVSAEF